MRSVFVLAVTFLVPAYAYAQSGPSTKSLEEELSKNTKSLIELKTSIDALSKALDTKKPLRSPFLIQIMPDVCDGVEETSGNQTPACTSQAEKICNSLGYKSYILWNKEFNRLTMVPNVRFAAKSGAICKDDD